MPGPNGYNLDALETLRERVANEVYLDEIEPRENGYKRHDQGTWGTFWGALEEKWEKFRGGGGTNGYAAMTCPTSACAAGHTTLAAGAKMLVRLGVDGKPIQGPVESVLTKDGSVRHISEYAAEVLGIDDAEQNRLFSGAPSSAQTLYNIDELICAAKHNRTWTEQRRLNGGYGLSDSYVAAGPMVETVDN